MNKILLNIFFLLPSFLFGLQSSPEIKYIKAGFSIDIFNQVDFRDAKVAIDIWSAELLDFLGENYRALPQIFYNNEEIVREYHSGNIDLLTVLSMDYFDLEKKISIEPGLITLVDDKIGNELVILVKNNSGINKINQLSDKSIIMFTGEFDKLIQIWTKTLLYENSIDIPNFYSKVQTVDKPSQAILPVFFNQKDACIVTKNSFDSMIELNPQLKELKILKKSPLLLNSFMCFNKELSTEFKEATKDIGSKLHSAHSGAQILKIFKSGKILSFKPEYLVETRKLYDKYNKISPKISSSKSNSN